MIRRLLTILLTLVMLVCAVPVVATAAIESPKSLGAPDHFGVSKYGDYGTSVYFTISAPEDIRVYTDSRYKNNSDAKSFSLYYQIDYKIDNGSWHHTSDWDSPKTDPYKKIYRYFNFVSGENYISSERHNLSSFFPEDAKLKVFDEEGWEYIKSHSITFRIRFAQSFDNGNTYVLSPWSKESILSASSKVDYDKLINHAPTLLSAEVIQYGKTPYFHIKTDRIPGEVQDLNSVAKNAMRTEVWVRMKGESDFRPLETQEGFQELIKISPEDLFRGQSEINYKEAGYEIKIRYVLDLRNYKLSGQDRSTTSVNIYSPFSNVISHNMPAWTNSSSWAAGELKKADDTGLIPDILRGADMTKPITREEFAELAVKLYEKTTGNTATPASPNPFTDTSNPEILKAFKVGVTTGTSTTIFGPKELTNREQVATMLSRAIRVIAPDADYSTVGAPSFTDQKDISSWAIEHVQFMSKLGIIKGTDGKFMPKATTTAQKAAGYATTTREMAIAMCVRSFEKMKSGDLDTLEEDVTTTPSQPTQPVKPTEPVSTISGIPKGDNGIVGVWLGTFFPYDGIPGLRWRWMTFFEDGTFYFDLPSKGFIGYDRSESKKTHSDFWGTYTFSEGSGIWKYNRQTSEGSEMTIADDGGLDTGGYGRFYRCVSVNGLKLSGSYTSYADSADPDLKKEGTKPVIRFKADGSFVDEGVFMVVDPFFEDEEQRALGSGTYEIKDFSLILHYSDGRTKQVGFSLGYKASIEESPRYIFMEAMLMTKMP